jgi:hypothetical protein
VHLAFAFGGEDEQRRAEVGVSDRAAKNEYAFCDKAVDERNVLAPPLLLSARPRRIPTRARELGNEEVIQPAPPSRFRIFSNKRYRVSGSGRGRSGPNGCLTPEGVRHP